MLIFSQNYYFCKIIEFFERNKVPGKLVSVLQIPKKPVESLERMKYTEFVIEAATESQREMLIAELSDYPFDGFTEEEDCLKAYISEADFRMWRSAIEESLERIAAGIRRRKFPTGTGIPSGNPISNRSTSKDVAGYALLSIRKIPLASTMWRLCRKCRSARVIMRPPI